MNSNTDIEQEGEAVRAESQQRHRGGRRMRETEEPAPDQQAEEPRRRRGGRSGARQENLLGGASGEPVPKADPGSSADTDSAVDSQEQQESEVQAGNTELAYWVKTLNEHIGWTAQSLVELGKLFLEAKSKLGHGDWQRLFDGGRLRFSLRWAQKLMQVAKNAALSNATNSALLPSSPDALSILARLEPEIIQQGIDDGNVHAEMTINQAKDFAARQQNEKDADAQPAFNYDRVLESIVGRVKKALEKVPADLAEKMIKDLTKAIRALSKSEAAEQA